MEKSEEMIYVCRPYVGREEADALVAVYLNVLPQA